MADPPGVAVTRDSPGPLGEAKAGAGPIRLEWSRPLPASLRRLIEPYPVPKRRGVGPAAVSVSAPETAAVSLSASEEVLSPPILLPVTLNANPRSPILATVVLIVLATFESALWWIALFEPVRDGGGRLLGAWEKLGGLAAFTAGIVCLGWSVVTSELASSAVSVCPRHLHCELRVGWLSLHREYPLASVYSFEIREVSYRGHRGLASREHRLIAHTRESGEVTVLYNIGSRARAKLSQTVAALNQLVRP